MDEPEDPAETKGLVVTDNDAAVLIKNIIASDKPIDNEVIDRLGGRRAQALLVCALAVAVDRRFPEGTDVNEVSGYMASLRSRYPDTDQQLKPVMLEALIRTMLGEEGLLDGVSSEELVPLEFLLVYDLMNQAGLSDAELDAYITEVTTMADNGE